MKDDPPILPYDGSNPPGKPVRWPWIVIGVIALACCVAYGCYFAGLVSSDSLVGGILGTIYVIIPVAAVALGIRYGTQKKDYWA